MYTNCRAAIVTEKGGKFNVIDDHPVREPVRGEVQLKVICVSLCVFDLSLAVINYDYVRRVFVMVIALQCMEQWEAHFLVLLVMKLLVK